MNAPSSQRELLKTKADVLTEAEVAEVLEYISIMQTMTRQTNEPALFDHGLTAAFFKARNKQKGRALRH